jgi:hypothetical protein
MAVRVVSAVLVVSGVLPEARRQAWAQRALTVMAVLVARPAMVAPAVRVRLGRRVRTRLLRVPPVRLAVSAAVVAPVVPGVWVALVVLPEVCQVPREPKVPEATAVPVVRRPPVVTVARVRPEMPSHRTVAMAGTAATRV